ncbi:MAG: diiron oxygenase [Lacibacter sp.]
MITAADVEKVERLIRLSETNAVLPDEFIPWEMKENNELLMPEEIVSLHGHPLFDTLSAEQKRELGRHEVVQVMYSYAWAEGLACFIFNKRLLKIPPDSVEYRYLVKELIEEFRHQDMFAKAIRLLKGKKIKLSKAHQFVGRFHSRYMPASYQFISVLAVELVTDIYGKLIRKSPGVFEPIRKVSELHHIEEGRHIHYTKLWMKHYTDKAGFFKRTAFSIVVLLNIWYMRSLYVTEQNFEAIGVNDPALYAKAAKKNLKEKFGQYYLDELIEFVKEFNGFNFITKPLWKRILSANI